jgi:hypothetical protein
VVEEDVVLGVELGTKLVDAFAGRSECGTRFKIDYDKLTLKFFKL